MERNIPPIPSIPPFAAPDPALFRSAANQFPLTSNTALLVAQPVAERLGGEVPPTVQGDGSERRQEVRPRQLVTLLGRVVVLFGRGLDQLGRGVAGQLGGESFQEGG